MLVELSILAIFLVLLLWRQRRKQFRFFIDRGIAGPTPNIFFGNALERFILGQESAYRKWYKEYGDVYGFFNGTLPVLVCSDKKVVKFVQIQKFTSFIGRASIEGQNSRSRQITNLDGDEWRHLRGILTPSFTLSKLKSSMRNLLPMFDELEDHICQLTKTSTEVDVRGIFKALTTDVICRTAFGMNYNLLREHDHPLIIRLVSTMRIPYDLSLISLLAIPPLRRFLPTFMYIREILLNKADTFSNPVHAVKDDCRQVIKHRRENADHRDDILQLMIDARTKRVDVENLAMNDRTEAIFDRLNKESSGGSETPALCDEDILQNSFILMLAGFETTAELLSNLMFLMATMPEMQSKLRAEIRANIEDYENVDFEKLQALPYLSAVIKETLRLYPPVIQSARVAAEDVELPNGVQMKKGERILFAINVIHEKEEYFIEPTKFRPERFLSDEVDPITFQAFVNGPRNCFGMRFAELEVKLVVAKLLLKFRITESARTPRKPKRKAYLSTCVLDEAVFVNFVQL